MHLGAVSNPSRLQFRIITFCSKCHVSVAACGNKDSKGFPLCKGVMKAFQHKMESAVGFGLSVCGGRRRRGALRSVEVGEQRGVNGWGGLVLGKGLDNGKKVSTDSTKVRGGTAFYKNL